MNTLNDSPLATAAHNLALRAQCFHRESTARILLWLDECNVKSFRPKDVDKKYADFDARTISIALKDLSDYGFLTKKPGQVMSDKRAVVYIVKTSLIRAIKTQIEAQM